MATQKFTWLFAAINRNQRYSRPIMLRVTANDEHSARLHFASDYILCFAGRLPHCGGNHE